MSHACHISGLAVGCAHIRQGKTKSTHTPLSNDGARVHVQRHIRSMKTEPVQI